jgi:hypothetical protein
MLAVNCHAQPVFVKETDTPIALHYAHILKEYVTFILPKLGGRVNLVESTQAYFDRLGYRVVSIHIQKVTSPKVDESWKIPNAKLAVLPRMVCSQSAAGATIQLYDQGDDFILLQNYVGDLSVNPGLFIVVGITHRWE